LNNGVQTCHINEYDEPARFPHIAFIRFTPDDHLIVEYIDKIKGQRSIVDLPTLILP
jgi:hypothetical protein